MSQRLAASTTRPAIADGQPHMLEADVFLALVATLDELAFTSTAIVRDFWTSDTEPDHTYEIAHGEFQATTIPNGLLISGSEPGTTVHDAACFYRIFKACGDETYQISEDGREVILTDGKTRVEITFRRSASTG